jgi:FxsC-like protein
MTQRLFFLSYARKAHDPYLDLFFKDLSTEVRICIGAGQDEEVGFMDVKGLELGDEWDEELGRALAECQVLVCVYTSGYFKSPFCGKELSVFRARREAQRPGATGRERPGLIIPVLWTWEGMLSECFAEFPEPVQYDEGFAPEYKTEGLRFLSKLNKKYEDEYSFIVHKLAQRICEEVRAARLKPSARILKPSEADDAFAGLKRPPAESLAENGPGLVRFILVAASHTELQDAGVRNGLGPYGAGGGFDWKPYWEKVTEGLALKAQGIAIECQLISDVVWPKDDFVQLIRDAERNNNIVVIIMDTWALQLEKYRAMMHRWGELFFYNCALLVPWNSADDETLRERRRLVDKLADTFPHRVRARDEGAERRLTSFDQFCIVEGIEQWDDLVGRIRESIKNVRARISIVSPHFSPAGPGQSPPPVFPTSGPGQSPPQLFRADEGAR